MYPAVEQAVLAAAVVGLVFGPVGERAARAHRAEVARPLPLVLLKYDTERFKTARFKFKYCLV